MNDFLRGARLALPIVMGYLPVGFAFGVLAVQAGMTPLGAGLMSFLVFAGSGQLIAASMLAANTGMAGIILTTFVVNLRHLLMSAAMTPYLRHWSKPLQAWFGFQMTDETFAANMGRFGLYGVNRGETLGLNAFAHLGWVAGGLGGALFDLAIDNIKPLGLDYALPAMFIALLLPHFRVTRRVIAVSFGAALSLIFSLLGFGQWSVILATMLAAAIGAFLPLPGGGRTGTDKTGNSRENGGRENTGRTGGGFSSASGNGAAREAGHV